jgi:energy-coupling factor transporter ATP-binding protein EcfA2
MEQPTLIIQSALFSDGTTVAFDSSDIVVLVGPNNAGKSECLRNIKRHIEERNTDQAVVKELHFETNGNVAELENWLESVCRKRRSGANVTYSSLGASVAKSLLPTYWSPNKGLKTLTGFFVGHLTTDLRLKAADPPTNIAITRDALTHPIHHLQANDEIELHVSSLFHAAFGLDLIVHRNAGNRVPLHCGDRPKMDCDRASHAYCEALERLPTLDSQGDGMRSFVGVMLHLLVGRQQILLIDEPDAFLHPPQARQLGRTIAKHTPPSRQLFIATHSGDFIRGLLDANDSRVRIIRLDRVGAVNRVAELKNEQLREIWDDPLLRYSNILDGIFHKKVIVCEGDADCRFYAAIHDVNINLGMSDYREEVMFTHCGGKDRISTVVRALRNVNVPVVAVLDFDVLRQEEPLRTIFRELGGDWSEIADDWQEVRRSVDEKRGELTTSHVRSELESILKEVSTDTFPKKADEQIRSVLKKASPWSIAKESGDRVIPHGDARKSYEHLLEKCVSTGLFIVQEGELEGFVPAAGGHGPSWVSRVLDEEDLTGEKLEAARKFVAKMIA